MGQPLRYRMEQRDEEIKHIKKVKRYRRVKF